MFAVIKIQISFLSVTRTLHSSNILYQETENTALCENKMELEINYEQLLDAQKDANVLIIDVREPSEISETGVLPGSIHIPSRNFLLHI